MPFEIKRVGGEGEAGQERALGNGHPPWAGEKLRKTSMVQCSEARARRRLSAPAPTGPPPEPEAACSCSDRDNPA